MKGRKEEEGDCENERGEKTKVVNHKPSPPVLVYKGVDKEIQAE